jgi:lycopene cyclase domain-containing protein
MTYFGFLIIFLVVPLGAILLLTWYDLRRRRRLPAVLDTWPAWMAVLLHVVIAVIYTTPWDNYLVATGVWYYPLERVTGLKLGWVPIEEYTFFVLQSLLTGFWLLFLAKRIHLPVGPIQARTGFRVGVILFLGILVIAGIVILTSGYAPGTYAALILVWALPPIMIQVGWGGHILWQYRKLVLTALISVTFYLAVVDSFAISQGIWTIDPNQSFHWFIFGKLPIEEFIFFVVTNTLLTFGVTLALAKPSLEQFARFRARLRGEQVQKSIRSVNS